MTSQQNQPIIPSRPVPLNSNQRQFGYYFTGHSPNLAQSNPSYQSSFSPFVITPMHTPMVEDDQDQNDFNDQFTSMQSTTQNQSISNGNGFGSNQNDMEGGIFTFDEQMENTPMQSHQQMQNFSGNSTSTFGSTSMGMNTSHTPRFNNVTPLSQFGTNSSMRKFWTSWNSAWGCCAALLPSWLMTP